MTGQPAYGSDRWQCFTWSGPAVEDRDRRDLTASTPPLRIQDWPRKPKTMLARVCQTPEQAVGWLRDQVEKLAGRIIAPDPGRKDRLLGYLDHRVADPAIAHHCALGPCDVLCRIGNHNRIVHWFYPLTGGEVVAWAIVPYRSPDLTRP